ncbi:hypothetical protein D3C75_232930 [compost metagenome]
MFNSLKAWANVPLEIRPFIKHDTAGDPEYGDLIEALCYPEAKARMVVDRDGREVISAITLYIDPVWRAKFHIDDALIFDDEEHTIKAKSALYRNGEVDIWVVNI